MVEEADKPLLGAFLGDVEDGFCPLTVIGIHKRDHFGKGLKGCKAVISGPNQVFALLLKSIEKGKDQLRGEVFHSEGFYLNAKMICRKGKEDLEGIPVGFDGIGTEPLDMGEVVVEEVMDALREFHLSLFCHRVKSTRFFRLMASATLRYKLVYL